jgi:solute carrier family 31 (copper transporter), member 1
MPGSTTLQFSLVISLYSVVAVTAHMNGMDMSMDGSMSLASGQMLPYLHFTTGDILWFLGYGSLLQGFDVLTIHDIFLDRWVPKSTGAMVGACIGLFLLAVFERWLAASRALGEAHWRTR